MQSSVLIKQFYNRLSGEAEDMIRVMVERAVEILNGLIELGLIEIRINRRSGELTVEISEDESITDQGE